jgi:hypothetical protein
MCEIVLYMTNKINYTNTILALCLMLALSFYFIFMKNFFPTKNNVFSIPQNSSPANTTSSESVINSKASTASAVVKNSKSATSSLAAKPLVSLPVHLKWGAYVGDAEDNLADFEALVGKRMNILADFEGWSDNFPLYLKTKVGQAGKTLVIFWEPSFGYDAINKGTKDKYIKKFAADARLYKYPVIMVPFAEMNLNEEAWGYAQNGNTAPKFKTAWIHVHNLFAGIKNVKFGLAYNNVSIPNIAGNQYKDYYPGSAYVDYVGVDGFDFGDPHLSFGQIFDEPIKQLSLFKKPIYIFSMAAIAGPQKATWIADGLGNRINSYSNVAGWIWFNESKLEEGRPIDWRVNSDKNALQAFKSVLP